MELQTERLSLRPMSDAELQTLMEAVRPRDAELADAYNDMLRGSREHPQPFNAVFTGDASLSRRPMGRVIKPLSQMGAKIVGRTSTRCCSFRTARAEASRPSAELPKWSGS